MNNIFSKKFYCWIYVCACVVLIYSTLYIVRPICEFLKTNTPFPILINSIVVLMLFAIVFKFINKKWTKYTFFYVFLVFALYSVMFFRLHIPEEKVHLIEYGLLSFLLYKALLFDLKKSWAYLAAFVIASFLGWIDERIQYILPNRYYNIDDVILNSISAALGLLLTYVISREQK